MSWVRLEGGRMSGHKRRVEVLSQTLARVPSHTSSGNSWAGRPWAGCTLDSATALEEVAHYLEPAGEPLLSPRWWTIS
jgi:hypothetical protein